mgnify:CR=1 FL=1
MSEHKQDPSVLRFEAAVHKKEYEVACNELLAILGKLDSNFGTIHGIEIDFPEQILSMPQECDVHFCTRVAAATTDLFSAPELLISEHGAIRFLSLQRWLAQIFGASPYINADHIIQTYNVNPDPADRKNIMLNNDNFSAVFTKICILYFPEANVLLNLDTAWEHMPNLCASLCFALQSPRFIGTPTAFAKRATILQWFPAKLEQLANLNHVPSGISHDVYMHCSYDTALNKHDVKRPLNHVIRRHLLQSGWQDRDVSDSGTNQGKPVMVVLLEHFHGGHSIYRTHSTSMVAAREHFHLIGIGKNSVDELGRQVFDEFVELSEKTIFDQLGQVREVCEKNKAAVLYMPSIGMDLITIFASNTRMAPIQAVALGHPATTHSDFIEYVVVEDDYVGSEECFSETLIRLPKDALPYVPSSAAPTHVEYRLRDNPEVVHIGVAATTMKLNPYFLAACQAIRDRAKVKVHFHFALGQSSGIIHPYVERFIKSFLGNDATAHAHLPYQQYMQVLHQCDMMVNPFPFGNTNGIIDMVTLGLVGVCKTGPEVHEHIDEGLFKRLGLPEWLIADTVDTYVECAVRLAENHAERLELRRHIIENNGLQTLFSGDPRPMGEAFIAKFKEWQAHPEQPLVQKKAVASSSEKHAGLPVAEAAPTAEVAPVKKASAKKAPVKKAPAKKAVTSESATGKKGANAAKPSTAKKTATKKKPTTSKVTTQKADKDAQSKLL